ncbi:MAG TPA: sialidase family protein [Rhodopila sp.]|nr:sialidase family protein [Rhodopila sp.]
MHLGLPRTIARAAVSTIFLMVAHQAVAAMDSMSMPGGPCAGPELACARSATPLLLNDDTLWLAWAAGGHVSVARSADHGASFSPAVMLNVDTAMMDNGPDARPKIVRDKDGRLIVAWSIFKDHDWNAQVLITQSTDDGHSFAKPHPISDDPASQRFEALQALPSGDLFAAWIDKRDAVAAKKAGQDYPGAALAFAWSKDGGVTTTPARIAQDNSCECCRLGVALTPSGQPVVLFRNIYDHDVRDHAVTTFGSDGKPGPVHRVSVDDYRIDGCPHHGPSLSISPAGTYHAAWFTNGTVRKGLFYARSIDGGATFSSPMALSSPHRHPARPYVLATKDSVFLVWKEFNGERTEVRMRQSRDDGATWSDPVGIASTDGDSDHPLLVSDGHRVFLSWLTHDEGYRLMPLGASS